GEMNAQSLERLQLEAHLRRAIEERQFRLFYQPQIDLTTGALVGFEALVRWQHPDLGLVSPGSFIPLAEETGLIIPMGEWVIDEACRQLSLWQSAGHRVGVSVNVSATQFAQANFLDRVAEILAGHTLDPGGLEFEVTETVIMRNAEETVETLRKIKQMGVRLSVDDFGTGYSSLSYLKRFPLDKLKIDRSFVLHLPDDEDDAIIAQAIMVLAGRLNLSVVAEGVETEAQCAFLLDHGCDMVQGYLFSPPVPVEQAEELLVAGCSTSSGNLRPGGGRGPHPDRNGAGSPERKL
ncbi:MAG: EAL domain-containing protein, partial [Pseudomonadota bacterium]|nr:EAL domain-containing protein [Pseudomonadota bacterium]